MQTKFLSTVLSFMAKFTPVWIYFSFSMLKEIVDISLEYRKFASSNTSRLEAHAGFFRLLMKGIFGPYVLWPFDKKVDFLISNAC